MVKKCKIVPSSEMTKFLIKKLLKTMNLSDYINNIILDIKDNNDDGKYDINDFLKINNNELLSMNSGKKFDVVLMNPPYSNKEQFLDMNFVNKVNNICKVQIVIHPAKKWVSNTKLGKLNAESKHIKSIEIVNANDIFNIVAEWKYAGIFEYDNTKEYTEYDVIFNGVITQMEYDNLNKRNDFYKTLDFSKNLINLINKKEDLYNNLIEKYKTMVNDGHGFVYEENDLKRGEKRYNIKKNDDIGLVFNRNNHYRKWLKDGVYKYCLYKGSYNHDYDEVQEWKGEDPNKLFNGQILWLTNSETVKNNIKYWMECPLFDLWRKYKLKLRPRNNIVSGCAYGEIPALDFEMNESEFKEYVVSLNNFTKEEIQVLKENRIHNAYKL